MKNYLVGQFLPWLVIFLKMVTSLGPTHGDVLSHKKRIMTEILKSGIAQSATDSTFIFRHKIKKK